MTTRTLEAIAYTRTRREPKVRGERCVICGYPQEKHGDGGRCPGDTFHTMTFHTMNLPADTTCGDCAHGRALLFNLRAIAGRSSLPVFPDAIPPSPGAG